MLREWLAVRGLLRVIADMVVVRRSELNAPGFVSPAPLEIPARLDAFFKLPFMTTALT